MMNDKKAKIIPDIQWSWSDNEYDWYKGIFNSIEEMVRDISGWQFPSDTVIYTAQCKPCALPHLDVDWDVLELLSEQYCENTGYEDDLYDNVSDENKVWLQEKLDEVITEFHDKCHITSPQYDLYNVKKYTIGELINDDSQRED